MHLRNAASSNQANPDAREGAGVSRAVALSFISTVNTAAPNAEAKPSWDAVQAQGLELSRAQHNGRPETMCFCEPQLKVCNIGVVWRAGNRTKLFLGKPRT